MIRNRLSKAFTGLSILLAWMSVEAASTPATAVFERLQTLVGDWEGKRPDGSALRVSYRMSAGNSVLVETWGLAPGRETMTLYHLDGKQLIATHYCAIGNQPTLQLSPPAGDETYVFELRSVTNLASASASHQHRFELRLLGKDRFWRSESYIESGHSDSEAVTYTRLSHRADASKTAANPAKLMQCGDARCDIGTEYCTREVFPTPEPVRHSCRKLPRPECGNHAVGGNCLGDAQSGYILEIIYP